MLSTRRGPALSASEGFPGPALRTPLTALSQALIRGGRWAAISAALALAACAAPPTKGPEAPPPVPSMEDLMSQADQAQQAGQREKARDAYRSAAKAYPTAKQPWLKLSEDYFAAADYGNAVLAGQEVLQRDPQDATANSILAVSGLRLTASSLKALRKDAAYPVGSREEALAVTRSLREALGETALLPIVSPDDAAQKAAAAPVKPRPPVRKASTPPAAGGAAAPAAAAAATAAPASPPPAPAAKPSANPLDKLK
ncbi:hypothetical protein LRH25_04625 [Ideonella azotifigens]|uniref:Tetratricopeptide repeat protein n=2 Tax=Ideonella azotifigens TaxID=513160 RepID=A0ABN1KI32_9BURK|nr:hypothetical protein [Ideonella azotifigens]MCD2339623.1 hypothetical protein [Ideonella azotifigens]